MVTRKTRTVTQEYTPINPDVLAERLAYAKRHPIPEGPHGGRRCPRCRSPLYVRLVRIHTFDVPAVESICTGGHSEYLGRIRGDGRLVCAA